MLCFVCRLSVWCFTYFFFLSLCSFLPFSLHCFTFGLCIICCTEKIHTKYTSFIFLWYFHLRSKTKLPVSSLFLFAHRCRSFFIFLFAFYLYFLSLDFYLSFSNSVCKKSFFSQPHSLLNLCQPFLCTVRPNHLGLSHNSSFRIFLMT